MDKGWIKLHRKIQDSWLWEEKEPYDKRSAWVDLLMSVNHADKKLLFNGEVITVERGQLLTSIRVLSNRWHWSINKVYRFLKLLEGDGMLRRKSDSSRTLLTVVNYEIYQGAGYTDENSSGYSRETEANTGADNKQEEKKERMEEGKKKKRPSKNKLFPPPEPVVYDPLDEKLNQAIIDFVAYRKSIKAPMTAHAIDLLINNLNKMTDDNNEKIQILERSMIYGWKGIFPLDEKKNYRSSRKQEKSFQDFVEEMQGEAGGEGF